MNALLKLDRDCSSAIHRAATSNAALTKLTMVGASQLIWFMTGMLLASTLFFSYSVPTDPQQYLKVFITISAVIGIPWLAVLALEYLIKRKRPFQVDGSKQVVDMLWVTPSFPSGHATISFAIATALLSTPFGAVAVVCAALVCLGRVAAGVHYVSDVIAGALLGIALIQLMIFLVGQIPTTPYSK